ncbi:hypothetical protein AB0O75_43700 [Streptomyces sp. NPDC088921]|uniref:hypothetical protein n=1 Tax=unclassified Streptomyces TaxID=2593676 RepID=UPI00342D031B
MADLEQASYLHRQRVGHRNQYTVNTDAPLRHPPQTGLSIRDFLNFLTSRADEDADVDSTH